MHNGPLTAQDKRELYKGALQGIVVAPVLYLIAVLFFSI